MAFLPAAASAQDPDPNLTCNVQADGQGVNTRDLAIGQAKCLSFSNRSYSVTVDLSIQAYDQSAGQWVDIPVCPHSTATGEAVDGRNAGGVASVVTPPIVCDLSAYPGYLSGSHRAHVLVTHSILAGDVRTDASDPWSRSTALTAQLAAVRL